ncbi:MAG: DNA repair protein RecN [Eubacterium sp.]
MLRTLDIENIAVIEKTTVDFTRGLNVLTGETGAGKSIIVDSINAVLGERTSRELVRHGAENAYVAASFTDICQTACNKLTEFGITPEDDGTLILSRAISAQGKSACKINGKPATVSMLKEIGSLLVNIHGQHDSQELLNPDCQYKYIDMLLNDGNSLTEYKKAFRELITVRRKLKSISAEEDEKKRRLELLDFQINELEAADIKLGEKEELTKKRSLIQKSEALISALNSALAALNGDDEAMGAEALITGAANNLSNFDEVRKITDSLLEISDKTEAAKDSITDFLDSLDFNPQELELVEDRLDMLYNFSGKYGSTEAEMLEYLENAKKERSLIINSEEEIERLSGEYEILLSRAVELADRLSAERKKTAEDFEKKVKSELEYLDMPKLQFKVTFDKGNLTSNGYDVIEFLISTNPGEPPKPLSKIASGGELSRIMLAIKNILAYNDTIGTLIFDEIDTGVSGRASQKIGLKLKAVSKNTQVLCVTHSAQIASNADTHFLIKKEFLKDRTYTNVLPLDFEGRKHELARIMGGLEITDSLLKSAEEMLSS